MGILSIIFGQTRASIGGIVIDAAVSEEHTTSAELTENPVEDGAKITDHVQLQPTELTIEGVISDTPLGYAVIGNIQNLTRSVTTLFGRDSRSIDAYKKLVELQKSREPFTVITGLRKYENMILTELSIPRTAETGRAIHFRATMKEIRIAKSETAGGGNFSPSVATLATPTKNLGQRVTDPVPIQNPLSTTPAAISNPSLPSKAARIFDAFLRN